MKQTPNSPAKLHSRQTKIKPKKPIWRHLLEIALLLVVVFGILWWQERHLLSRDDKPLAPSQQLISLDEKRYQIPAAGQKQLLYFFAPWCKICRFSIGNIEAQKPALLKKGFQVRYVALDWQNKTEVAAFAKEQKLTFPVLMGTLETMQQYQVQGFPTYYLVDEQGRISAGSQGYSTSLGIWLRSLNN
ncbi:TlpA disulfide reductase family protein [Kangiella sp. TOML190]|uniref:TlpA disulfide reductase family protein n=1 Tax=Kangiella sp. TOML190 TaxID=2931351 RepID=UPI00203F96AD|nr:TlpA disulfide reductase family protein [Kangiella sp. TOML190]